MGTSNVIPALKGLESTTPAQLAEFMAMDSKPLKKLSDQTATALLSHGANDVKVALLAIQQIEANVKFSAERAPNVDSVARFEKLFSTAELSARADYPQVLAEMIINLYRGRTSQLQAVKLPFDQVLERAVNLHRDGYVSNFDQLLADFSKSKSQFPSDEELGKGRGEAPALVATADTLMGMTGVDHLVATAPVSPLAVLPKESSPHTALVPLAEIKAVSAMDIMMLGTDRATLGGMITRYQIAEDQVGDLVHLGRTGVAVTALVPLLEKGRTPEQIAAMVTGAKEIGLRVSDLVKADEMTNRQLEKLATTTKAIGSAVLDAFCERFGLTDSDEIAAALNEVREIPRFTRKSIELSVAEVVSAARQMHSTEFDTVIDTFKSYEAAIVEKADGNEHDDV